MIDIHTNHRMNVKLFFTVISVCICSINIQAQMVVSDANMLVASMENWASQLQQAEQNFKQFQEQTRILKAASDALKKVNSNVATLRSVKSLVEQQSRLISFFSSEISRAKSQSVNYESTTVYVKRLNNMQDRIITNTAYLSQLLSEGIFNMSDADRIRELRTIEEENGKIITVVLREKDKFDTLNAQLKEIDRLMKN